MKKALSVTLPGLVCLISILAIFLYSCATPYVDPEGTAILVVMKDGVADEYEVHLSKIDKTNGAFGALDYLEGEGLLEYDADEGMFGAFLTRVGRVEQKSDEGVYIGIWTDNAAEADTSGFFENVEYKGMTLYPSGVGISSMSLYDKSVIYIGEIVY